MDTLFTYGSSFIIAPRHFMKWDTDSRGCEIGRIQVRHSGAGRRQRASE
jgi:hypothetical protein